MSKVNGLVDAVPSEVIPERRTSGPSRRLEEGNRRR